MTIGPMSNFSSTKKWPEGAVEDWQQGASYEWIRRKYGRAYSTVAKLIQRSKELGAKRMVDTSKRKRIGGRKPLADERPISTSHHSIGIRLNRYREIDHTYNYQEMADLIKVNRLTVRRMELGLHDFTVGELQRIAGLLETSIEELMKPFG